MAKQNIGLDIPLTSGMDLDDEQFYFVEMSAGANAVCVVDSATDMPIGVLQNHPAANGREASVRIAGTTKLVAGESISIGDSLGSGADGKATVLTEGTSTQNYICAMALTAATTDGQIIEALLMSPHRGS